MDFIGYKISDIFFASRELESAFAIFLVFLEFSFVDGSGFGGFSSFADQVSLVEVPFGDGFF